MALSSAVAARWNGARRATGADWRSSFAVALLPIAGFATIAWIGFWLWLLGSAVLAAV